MFAFVGSACLRFCFCLCLRFSRRVALFWCNRAFVFVNATYLVLFRFSACALFKQFLFCSETDKINRYIINNCFAFVDFVHRSIAFMKSWYCFFVFASRFVLLILFMFVFFPFRCGGLLIYELILFVFFTKKILCKSICFCAKCELQIENQKSKND